MNYTRKKVKLALFTIAILLIGMAVLLIEFDPLYLGASNDEELITVFEQHQADFVELEKMMAEDRVSYVTEQYVDPNLTRTRWAQYKALMEKIGPGLVLTYTPQSIRFVFSTGGLLSIGPDWEKGIEYVNNVKDAGILKGTLDNPRGLIYGQVYLRLIQPGWFIYFEKTR